MRGRGEKDRGGMEEDELIKTNDLGEIEEGKGEEEVIVM
jgi:hypothetical protein